MQWEEQRRTALKEAGKALRNSVSADNHITHCIRAIEELDKAANLLVKRLREWYELYSPEYSRSITDNEAFTRNILLKSRDEQFKEMGIQRSLGADFSSEELDAVKSLAQGVRGLYEKRDMLEAHLEVLMKAHCPNLSELAGVTIGARLLQEAGSLEKLAKIASSTIQVYGAEKALFRHLKTGAKPPKYGYIINHPFITQAKIKDKGRVARVLADKISIACKVDYFKGESIGHKLREELKAKFGDGK